MTFVEFMELVAGYQKHHPKQRRGQAIMNALFSVRRDLYEQALTEKMDVFYCTDDSDVTLMLSWLEKKFTIGGSGEIREPVQLHLPF